MVRVNLQAKACQGFNKSRSPLLTETMLLTVASMSLKPGGCVGCAENETGACFCSWDSDSPGRGAVAQPQPGDDPMGLGEKQAQILIHAPSSCPLSLGHSRNKIHPYHN